MWNNSVMILLELNVVIKLKLLGSSSSAQFGFSSSFGEAAVNAELLKRSYDDLTSFRISC